MNDTKLIEVLIAILLAIPLVLGIWWLLWLLWCAVLGAIWPAGPAWLVLPGYWLFVGELFCLGIVGSAFRKA